MTDLTGREQIAFDLLKKGPATPDDIRLACEAQGIYMNDNHSIIILMKYLASKVCQDGWIIFNKGGIGRGRNALYEMEKKF